MKYLHPGRLLEMSEIFLLRKGEAEGGGGHHRASEGSQDQGVAEGRRAREQERLKMLLCWAHRFAKDGPGVPQGDDWH